MQYGYVKAIKDISVASQVDILISHKVGKEHIYIPLAVEELALQKSINLANGGCDQ